jgi:hypothetical protein
MSKDQKQKHPRAAHLANLVTREWGTLFEQLGGVADWALDIAAKLSLDYEDDLAAIENVRAFLHAWMEGRRAEVPVRDLLTALAILFAAIELDLGIESVSLLAPLHTFLGTPSVLPALIRCPGAARDGEATVNIRRFPRRRNASTGFTHFAAA